ncbi:MAG: nodulation protein NodH [Pseudomonadota bacterium]
MASKFAAFVILAEMRTGSNHLQDSLNALSDVTVHGEIYNPAFIGQHNRDSLFGLDIAARDADPQVLLDRLIAQDEGLPGFRYFSGHDPRMRERILTDHKIAKVILTREPVSRYVSWKIARATDQWRLTNPKMAKTATVPFDPSEFDAQRDTLGETAATIRRTLQRTGQTAFVIDYAEINDLTVLNGLAAYLGSEDRLEKVPDRLKRQNPGDLREKVTNPDEMLRHVSAAHIPDAPEPTHGPAVRTMLAGARSPILLLPIPGGPTDELRAWLTAFDGEAPLESLRQNALRDWFKTASHPIVLAVLRHPLRRLHHLFWQDVLMPTGPNGRDRRRVLANQHAVPVLRGGSEDAGYDRDAHARAFGAFLNALPAILGGQTSLSVPAGWHSQSSILIGMARAVLAHRIVKEEETAASLADVAAQLARPAPPLPEAASWPVPLDTILTDEMLAAARRAHGRDYLQFGFDRL